MLVKVFQLKIPILGCRQVQLTLPAVDGTIQLASVQEEMEVERTFVLLKPP